MAKTINALLPLSFAIMMMSKTLEYGITHKTVAEIIKFLANHLENNMGFYLMQCS